ncbi:MAG TPA: LPS export ABC transporter periplasmic protein LptC, partial [Bacteroidales bacterium]|nr:LPS export ABC transporter periplasmic protein LptC [Bacteroidales bacterium]
GSGNLSMNKNPEVILGAIVLLIISVLFTSCETNVELIKKSEILNYPSSSGKNIVTIMRDSGNLQVIIKTPLVEQYDTEESSYSEFRKGIRVDYYDGDTVPKGSATANYAKYTQKDDLWLLQDSVIVMNEKNEKLETELLYWDRKKDLIYTERFVKITTEKSITTGIGFESDSHLNRRRIKNVKAEIFFDEDEGGF